MISFRIKSARLMRGLSMRELADKIGLSHNSINKFEKNKLTPNSTQLIKLSRALNVELDYFFRDPSLEVQSVSFRKKSKLGSKEQKKIINESIEFLERYIYVENLFKKENNKKALSYSQIDCIDNLEQIAKDLRKKWKLGLNPIDDLVESIEENDIKVVILNYESSNFDGCSFWLNNDLPVIVISKQWPGDRQRFTLAHELGHILFSSTNSIINEEKIANRFAGAFLFPKESVIMELGEKRSKFTLEELSLLKQKYGISIQCIIFRAYDLNIISESFFNRIWKIFNSKGWKQKEPTPPVKPEEPKRFERLIYKAYIEGIISASKSSELIKKPVEAFKVNARQLEATM